MRALTSRTHHCARHRTRLADEVLAAQAAYVLRGNDLGSMTTAAPRLYPHMWSWDVAFIAIGMARLSVDRAILEMETLLTGQSDRGPRPARSPCRVRRARHNRRWSGPSRPPLFSGTRR